MWKDLVAAWAVERWIMSRSHCRSLGWRPMCAWWSWQIWCALCTRFAPESLIYLKNYAKLWGFAWPLPEHRLGAALVASTSPQIPAWDMHRLGWCVPKLHPGPTKDPPRRHPSPNLYGAWCLAGWQKNNRYAPGLEGSEQINYCFIGDLAGFAGQ